MSWLPYSLDLALCDYRLNSWIERNLTDESNEKPFAYMVLKMMKNISEEFLKKVGQTV